MRRRPPSSTRPAPLFPYTTLFRSLGRAFGTMIRRAGGRGCALGRDGRLSSPQMTNAFARGLKAAGIDVYRIGLGPTPMLYFAERHLDRKSTRLNSSH